VPAIEQEVLPFDRHEILARGQEHADRVVVLETPLIRETCISGARFDLNAVCAAAGPE
jgi:hypothetical protein